MHPCYLLGGLLGLGLLGGLSLLGGLDLLGLVVLVLLVDLVRALVLLDLARSDEALKLELDLGVEVVSDLVVGGDELLDGGGTRALLKVDVT